MKTLREIQVEQHEWSLRNFGPHGPDDPLDGLIEEFGELHHAVLKRRQGIRGTAEEHDAAERDALGDMVIYALDLLSTVGCEANYTLKRESESLPITMRRHMLDDLASIAITVLTDGEDDRPLADALYMPMLWLLERMTAYASTRGWSLLEIVNETWTKVSQRDWSAAPKDGGA